MKIAIFAAGTGGHIYPALTIAKEFNEKEAFECVFIHKNGKALIKSVETGIQDDQNIEIISGLNEGDEVIKAVSYTHLTLPTNREV